MRNAILIGLLAGTLSALGRVHLTGTVEEFANSISTWLVVPFVVGTLAASRRKAAVAGVLASVAQLAAYYPVAALHGLGTTAELVAFWVGCAVLGGSIFGVAGHDRRLVALAAVFIFEGLVLYLYRLDEELTGVLWVMIGVVLVLVALRLGGTDYRRPDRRIAGRC